jgi:hypothetical protein
VLVIVTVKLVSLNLDLKLLRNVVEPCGGIHTLVVLLLHSAKVIEHQTDTTPNTMEIARGVV